MKRTLIALFLSAAGMLVSGCGLCPIPGLGNISSIQTSFFKLEQALPASTWTHVGDYAVRQDVTYPPGQFFVQIGYGEESPKRKKVELCLQITQRRSQQIIKQIEQCQSIRKKKAAKFFVDYPAGYGLEANDLLEMWIYSKKRQSPGVSFETTLGYRALQVTQ